LEEMRMKFVRNIPARRKKTSADGKFLSLDESSVDHINNIWGATIQARYYKGTNGAGDNLVIVQFKE
jgi:hypothetical protein